MNHLLHMFPVLVLAWAWTGLGAQENRPPVGSGPPVQAPSPAYVGDTVHFRIQASDPDGDSLTYSWNFGDGTGSHPSGGMPEATHVFTAPGRYPIIVRIRDSHSAVTASAIVAIHLRGTVRRPTASTSVLLDSVLNRIWCVNPDNNSVSAVDGASLSLLFERSTGSSPQTLAQAPDGHIWVANRASSTLTILSPAGQFVTTVPLPYGSGPHGIAFSPDGKAGYVTLEGSGKLLKVDPVNRLAVAYLDLGPTPRGIAITTDSRHILITRFISPEDHAEVWEVDAVAFVKARTHSLAEDRSPDDETGGAGILNYLNSVVISPIGGEAILPAKKDNTRRGLARNGLPLTFESTVRTVAARLDLTTGFENPALRNDFDNASQAAAVAFSPLGDMYFVALQGSNGVQVLDPYNSGAVLERIAGVGAAPRGLVVDGRSKRLYVHNFLDRSLAVFDISATLANTRYESKPLKSVSTVVQEALPQEVLRGKRIFYNAADSNMSRDAYISCAACHLDGGSDGRVWDFTDRGEGLRRTTSLLGRSGMGHGPVHWSANFDEIQDFEHDMRGPFGGRGFMADADFMAGNRNTTLGDRKAGLSPELDALAAYVASLTKVNPSPFRNADGSLTAEAREGERIFHRADVGCAVCHVPPLYTDSHLKPPDFSTGLRAEPGGFLLHDVGTLKPTSGKRLKDTLQGLDTPTLLGIWEMGPYLHDGSAPALVDVVTTGNPHDKHGKTSHLSPEEKGRLVEFLRQLDHGAAPVAIGGGRGVSRSGYGLAVKVMPGKAGLIRIVIQGGHGAQMPRLSLWDNRGRRLSSFRSANVLKGAGGEWVMTWDGRDAGGRLMPAGIYIFLAQLESTSATAIYYSQNSVSPRP